MIGAVSRAATQVLVEAFEPGLVLEMFSTYRANAMLGVPTMLVAMLERGGLGKGDYELMRVGGVFGATNDRQSRYHSTEEDARHS